MNLSINIGKSKFNNPVTVASGTFNYIEEYFDAADIKKLGAVVLKTVTLNAREGNPTPRIVETPSGMLNAIGIENQGIDYLINKKLPALAKIGAPIIVSVLGYSKDEFQALAEKLNADNCVSAVELNLSCPNLAKKNLVSQDADATFEVVKAVKKVTSIPVIAKLSPNVTDITAIAKSAEDAGADAVSMINTITGMLIDVKKRKPVLGNITGGLSGPAIMPIALRMVYQTAKVIKIPIIAMGGIMSADDALQFIIAGASMVAVGTGNFINPSAPLEILDGIRKYMKENKISDIKDLIGNIA